MSEADVLTIRINIIQVQLINLNARLNCANYYEVNSYMHVERDLLRAQIKRLENEERKIITRLQELN